MQGTQYAPRESILCMEHFVALQGTLHFANIAWSFTTGNVLDIPETKSWVTYKTHA